MEENITVDTPKPNPLTTVTPLSKFIALILFISLPFLGFYLGMGYQALVAVPVAITPGVNTSTSDTPTEKSQSTPSATNEMANWKTYTNTKYNFSFQYPRILDSYLNHYEWGAKIECACMDSDWLDIEVVLSKLTAMDWWQTSGKETFDGRVGVNNKFHPEAYKIVRTSSKTLAGINVFEVKAETKQPQTTPGKAIGGIRVSATPYRILMFNHNGLLLVITNYDTYEDPKVFDQILSTFKFLN